MSRVKATELHFLVLHWLKSTSCQESASVLEHELERLSLLPTVPSLNSTTNASYEALTRIFQHVPHSALAELVEEYVNHQIENGNTYSATNVVSLLESTGSFSFIPSVRRQVTPSTVIVPPPSCNANFLQLLYQREFRKGVDPLHLTENLTRVIYDRLHHIKTLRGHRKAVYCVALDRSGRFILTGADDGLIKIWNVQLGLLLITCRGHIGEITDLKINCDDSIFASSSIDSTVRVWSLKDDQDSDQVIGQHLCALLGHQEQVTFLSFHPRLRAGLLSVSLDGTCRLWEAERGIEVIRLKPVGRFGHFYNSRAFDIPLNVARANQNEAQFVSDRNDVEIGLTCCAFSATGEHFSVSSRSGNCYLWHWEYPTSDLKNQNFEKQDLRNHHLEKQDFQNHDLGSSDFESYDQTWPDVSSYVELIGHRKDVPLLCFDHHGNGLFTASSDGSLKLWKPSKTNSRISTKHAQFWKEIFTFRLPDPLPCPLYNNRRKKQIPECNQIAWSCDDQYLLGAFSCSVILVWNATTGGEENILYGGHADTPVHVLETHPTDRKLCFSAGYDGMLILWDIIAGHKLKELSSQDTYPGRCRWADALQFIDGRFTHDGTSIIVSDVAGQVHFYGLESPSTSIRHTPYDQFFLYDYDRVILAEQGEPIDMESGEPQHIHRMRFSMVDLMGLPYDPDIQELLLTPDGDLTKILVPLTTPPALLEMPPTISATLWLANEMGLGPQATATRVQAARQRQLELMQESGGGIEDFGEFLGPPVQEVEEIMEMEIDEESDDSEYTPEEGEPEDRSPPATRRSERIQTRGGVFFETPPPMPQQRRIPTRQNPTVDQDDEEESDEEEDEESIVESELESESPVSVETPVSVRVRRRRARRRRRVVVLTPEPVSSSRSRRSRRRRRVTRAPVAGANLRRQFRSYKWLSETRRPCGYYVPQLGDRVVLFPQIHQSFCDDNTNLATQLDPAIAHQLRFAEPCEIVELRYEIAELTELLTVAHVVLKLLDHGDFNFEVVIPPPIHGHEEFLIHSSVFLRSLSHHWSIGQRCRVFYCGDSVEWWEGEIVEDRLLEDEDEESIWDCQSHYRRFSLQWEGGRGMEPETFSPWELQWEASSSNEGVRQNVEFETSHHGCETSHHDVGTSHHECETSQQDGSDELETSLRGEMIDAILGVMGSSESEHFRETLDPETSFPLPDQRANRIYYNRVIPLPLSLTTIQLRLEEPTYYTNIQSFTHDLDTIVGNAELFTGPESGVSIQARSVRDFVLSRIQTGESTVPRRRRSRRVRTTTMNSTVTNQNSSDYQIRTRGMAKRERETETEQPAATRTRRRCTRLM